MLIILPQAVLMNGVQTKSLFRSTVRAEFVGHDRRRRKAVNRFLKMIPLTYGKTMTYPADRRGIPALIYAPEAAIRQGIRLQGRTGRTPVPPYPLSREEEGSWGGGRCVVGTSSVPVARASR